MVNQTERLKRRPAKEVIFKEIGVGKKINKEKSVMIERLTSENNIEDAELKKIFNKCLPNTFETTVEKAEDGTYFIFTGDLKAMWLRDSSLQLYPYIKLAKKDSLLRKTIKGVIRRQVKAIIKDPYSYAFYKNYEPRLRKDGRPIRKFALDSLCWPVWLVWKYWKETKEKKAFDEEFQLAMNKIIEIFETEQKHNEKSEYNAIENFSDNDMRRKLSEKENPVKFTGMIWSGFRPSDDPCQYNYHIPSQMLSIVVLEKIKEIYQTIYNKKGQIKKCKDLKQQINDGIKKYGIFPHPKYGDIYAYEVDGLGNYNLMDDANIPSLLSAPWLEYIDKENKLYQNTRRFILSEDNPYYCEGKYAKGVGSPHRKGVWPLSLIIQAFTSDNPAEVKEIIECLKKTTGNTYYMHEAFDPNDPTKYSRGWIAWANSMFAALIMEKLNILD